MKQYENKSNAITTISSNIKQQKQALRASGSGDKSGGGGAGMPGLDIMGMGLKFISGVMKFIGILMVGVLVNNLPAIISTVKGVWKSIKGAVSLTWKVIRVVGRTMARFGKFVANLFNRGHADENVKNIEQSNAELQETVDEVEQFIGPLDDEDLSMGEDEDDSEESETGGGDEEATDKPAEVKPATTSTTPPSAEKANEAGTGDKLVKDKPLPKEDTKAKKDQKKQEEKPKEQWTMVDVNEKGFVYKNAAGETKTVTFDINEPEKFLRLTFPDLNVIEILSCIDSNNFSLVKPPAVL